MSLPQYFGGREARVPVTSGAHYVLGTFAVEAKKFFLSEINAKYLNRFPFVPSTVDSPSFACCSFLCCGQLSGTISPCMLS